MEVGEETVAWLGAMVLTTGPAEDDTGEFIGGTGDRGGQGGDGRGGEMLQLDMVCALVCYGARWMHRCEDAGDGCGDEKDGNARGVAQKPEMRDTHKETAANREKEQRGTRFSQLSQFPLLLLLSLLAARSACLDTTEQGGNDQV